MEATCKPVPGHECYWVSETGQVYDLDGTELPSHSSNGYKAVWLDKQSLYVHRLVAQTFLPNPDDKPQVAHWDGSRDNNSVANLRWVTQSENEQDKARHGTSNHGTRNGRSKLTEADVMEIRELRASGSRAVDLAARFNVSKWTVYDACNPKRQWSQI